MQVIWLFSSYTKHLKEKESDEVPSPDENLRLAVVDLLVTLMSELKIKKKEEATILLCEIKEERSEELLKC